MDVMLTTSPITIAFPSLRFVSWFISSLCDLLAEFHHFVIFCQNGSEGRASVFPEYFHIWNHLPVAFIFEIIIFYFLLKYSCYQVVLLSGVQQSDSVIHIHISIYVIFQILFHYRLLQDIEYSSRSYTVGTCLSILYIVVYIC